MATNQPTTAQPKISRKLILRTAALMFVLAALFFAYQYIEGRNGDFDFGSANTVGMIAAIQYKADGQELVAIKPDGSVMGTKSWTDKTNDRDPAWQPDGRFIFFSSDRTEQTNHLWRWNPDRDDAESRTIGKRDRSAPTFPADNPPDAVDSMLMISGGVVQGFDAKKKSTPQLLPPQPPNITQSQGDESAITSTFEALYGSLGTSFRYARWCKGNRYIAAILLREGGETLIIQNMTPQNGRLPPPIAVAAGRRVDFDVNPKDGSIVFVAQNFQFPDAQHVPPQFIKDNKITVPFRHLVGIADPEGKAQAPIGAANDDKACFGAPAISPDGASVLLLVGPYDPSAQSMQPRALISVPIKSGGIQLRSPLIAGDVHEPSWSPDGEQIAFAMRANGHRDIYTIKKDGSAQKNVTGGKGDFGFPKFSPQVKAAPASAN